MERSAKDIKLGSHVGMAGKEMFLASVKEAEKYGANVLMLYTGAPQNTRRKDISELNIEAAGNMQKKPASGKLLCMPPILSIWETRKSRKPLNWL